MKRSARFRLALLIVAVVATQKANAGWAVTTDGHGHLVYSYGHPKEIAKQRAFEMSRRLYGTNVKLIAASDVTGYGAIAVARKGTGSVVGVSLGRPSRADAENRAIEKCLIAGGTDPRIRWRWRG
jgi:hypothetical protein